MRCIHQFFAGIKSSLQKCSMIVRPLMSMGGWHRWRQHRRESACGARQRWISPCALEAAHGKSIFRRVALVRRVLLERHTVNTCFAVCACFHSQRTLWHTANYRFPVVPANPHHHWMDSSHSQADTCILSLCMLSLLKETGC